jgi:hypothetical protein
MKVCSIAKKYQKWSKTVVKTPLFIRIGGIGPLVRFWYLKWVLRIFGSTFYQKSIFFISQLLNREIYMELAI